MREFFLKNHTIPWRTCYLLYSRDNSCNIYHCFSFHSIAVKGYPDQGTSYQRMYLFVNLLKISEIGP